MKVQKIGLDLKIGAARAKTLSGEKVTSSSGDQLRISKNTNELHSKPETSQVYYNAGIKVTPPRINLLNPAYSGPKIESANINKLKNFPSSTPSGCASISREDPKSLILDIREEKIKEAKIRLAQGYYSRAEIYSKVAEKILDILI